MSPYRLLPILHVIYILLVLPLGEVKCEYNPILSATWRDMNENIIQVPEYCDNKHKPCLIKCCPEDHAIEGKEAQDICTKAKDDNVKKRLKFSDIYVHNEDDNSTVINTNESIKSAFIFVQNEFLSDLSNSYPLACNSVVLEDGSLSLVDYGYYLQNLQFCFDIYNNSSDKLLFTVRTINTEDPYAKTKHIFVQVGFGVSGFFCALVLVVYCLLSYLRTLQGLITMAYLATFTATCVMKVIQIHRIALFGNEYCLNFSIGQYYIILATFFWLNAMSFDVWRMTTRPLRGRHLGNGISKSEKWRKFFYYCVYGWLTPALLTLVVVIIDRQEVDTDYQPPFNTCFTEEYQVQLYVHVPIAILLIMNIIWFGIAAFTIWMIKGQVSNNTDSKKNDKSQSRFFTCFKVFVLTGGAWILEVIPDSSLSIGLYFLINFFNVFVGIPIFFMFVCNRKTIYNLCKRFNMDNGFVDRLQPSQRNTKATSSTKMTNITKKPTSEQERLTIDN